MLLSDTFVGTRLPSSNRFNTISYWIHAKLQALSPCADNVIILAEVTTTWSLHTCAISLTALMFVHTYGEYFFLSKQQ